jgi:hypothetical protein
VQHGLAEQIYNNPALLVDGVIEPFKERYEAGDIAGALGYALPAVVEAIVGTKGVATGAKATKVSVNDLIAYIKRPATNNAGVNLSDGFGSFSAFKRQYGPAGQGQAWHHLVEQGPNTGKFAAEAIHNPANLIKLPHGTGTIHNQVSGFYSSKQPFTGGKTVRNWLSEKPYQEQFDFGVQTIKDFGGNQYLPTHLR